MTKTLVIGATGFVGSYVIETALARGDEVFGTGYNPTIGEGDYAAFADKVRRCDIRYREQVDAVISTFRPDVIYHLAAQSFPAVSWSAPAETLETNVLGTVNVLESVRCAGIDPILVVACSSAQYGDVAAEDIPVKESHPMRPLHSYGVSKVATELLALQYWDNFRIRSICARIFNTTGPRKRGDVCSDFTKRAVAIELGLVSPVLKVGNLQTYRAFTDVRDMVAALHLLAEKGASGEAYNISGSRTYKVEEVVHLIRAGIRTKFEVTEEESLLRPSDELVIFGDSRKLVERTGWQQNIPLTTTVKDMLEYWRAALPAGGRDGL